VDLWQKCPLKQSHNNNHFTALWLSRTTQVSWYQKRHSPTHTYSDHQPRFTSFISFLHLLRSMASSLLNLRA